jgi:CotS family spore coat protein
VSLITQIEQEYGIRVTELTPIRTAFRAFSNNGRVLCVKPMNVPRQEVKFVVIVLKHLRKKGYSYSPKVLYTKQGKPWMNRHGVRYLLTNWIDGHSPDFTHFSHLKKTVKTLAKFHIHAEGLEISNIPEERNLIVHLEENFQFYKSLIQKQVPSEQAKPFVEMCDTAIYYLQKSGTKKAIQQEVKKKSFVHGDYNYHNLIIDSTEHCQLIDFDNTALQVRMYDLVHLMYRVCPWNGDDALRLLEVYDQVRPISQDDLRLFVTLRYIPGSFIRSMGWGKLDIPSSKQIHSHLGWLQKTYG